MDDSPQMQVENIEVINTGPLEEEIDAYKKARRQIKSLDISSKAFVPTNRSSSASKNVQEGKGETTLTE